MCPHLASHKKRKIEGRKAGGKFCCPKLGKLSCACFISGPRLLVFYLLHYLINSCFLILTEQFVGYEEGKMRWPIVRCASTMNHLFAVFFCFLWIINEHLEPLGDMGKGFKCARNGIAEKSWKKLKKNLRCCSVSSQCSYLESKRTFQQIVLTAYSELYNLWGRGKGMTQWFRLELFNFKEFSFWKSDAKCREADDLDLEYSNIKNCWNTPNSPIAARHHQESLTANKQNTKGKESKYNLKKKCYLLNKGQRVKLEKRTGIF